MPSKSPRLLIVENPQVKEGYSHADPSEVRFSLNYGHPLTAESNQRMVELLAPEFAPATTKGEAKADPDELYSFTSSGSLRSFQHYMINKQIGTVQAPLRFQKAVEDSLFLKEGPSIDDVKQGGISNCYFMAALSNIASKDGEHLRKMVRRKGDNIEVDFFTYNPQTKQWSPITIVMNDDLLVDEGEIEGAKYRFSSTPEYSEWFAKVHSESLLVVQDSYHLAALWAPFLEKAYAIYAENFGRYGGSHPELESDKKLGYDKIEDGYIMSTYAVFYGNRAIAHSAPKMDISAKPLENEQIIRGLAELSSNGGNKPMLSASISRETAWQKFTQEIFSLRGKFPDTKLDITIETLYNSWDSKTFDAKNPSDDLINLVIIIQKESLNFTPNPTYDLSAVAELAAVVLRGLGGKFIRPYHAYSVLNATFKNSKGDKIAGSELVSSNRHLSEIDVDQSRVQLRNPWGHYEPNGPQGEESGKDDGLFYLSLKTYLHVFESQRQVMIAPK